MLGIIPHTVDQYLRGRVSSEVRKSIFGQAGFLEEQRFRLDTEYSDETCRALIDAIALETKTTTESVFEEIAEFFINWAEHHFSGFFAAAPDTRSFLMLQPNIHNSLACGLRSGYRQKVADKFRVEELPDGVRMHYRSSNRLGYFYCALARCLAARRGEVAETCFVEGDPGAPTAIIEVKLRPAREP